MDDHAPERTFETSNKGRERKEPRGAAEDLVSGAIPTCAPGAIAMLLRLVVWFVQFAPVALLQITSNFFAAAWTRFHTSSRSASVTWRPVLSDRRSAPVLRPGIQLGQVPHYAIGRSASVVAGSPKPSLYRQNILLDREVNWAMARDEIRYG